MISFVAEITVVWFSDLESLFRWACSATIVKLKYQYIWDIIRTSSYKLEKKKTSVICLLIGAETCDLLQCFEGLFHPSGFGLAWTTTVCTRNQYMELICRRCRHNELDELFWLKFAKWFIFLLLSWLFYTILSTVKWNDPFA